MSNQTFQASDDGVNWYIGLFEGTPVPRYITINHGTRYRLVDPASVVVLDPDDVDAAVELLRRANMHMPGVNLRPHAEALCRALRSLLPSPPLPEPNGLGAVVHNQGVRFVRWSLDEYRCWKHEHASGEYRSWSQFIDPTVLSHGVGCTCGAPVCNGGDQ